MLQMETPGLSFILVGLRPGNFLDACVYEECAPSLQSSRLLGRSSFGNAIGRFEDATSENIQERISLGGSLMWNYAAVCGGIK